MLVMAVPEWHAIRLGIERARRLNPRLFVVARATAAAHVEDLRALRVDAVVQPEFEGGLEMVRRALAQCDRGDDEIDRLTEALRRGLYDGEPA
jgi:CPA2 family monovalent cation:H+ antiporter-2